MSLAIFDQKPLDPYSEIVRIIESHYWQKNTPPTVEYLCDELHMPTEKVRELLTDPTVVKALTAKHLIHHYTDRSKGFTLKQMEVLQLLTNPNDRRTVNQKLKSCKVTSARLAKWMDDQNFVQVLNERTMKNFKDEGFKVFQALLEEATSGDVPAIKLYMEMAGHYTPTTRVSGNINVNDSGRVVGLLVEAIQRIVPQHVDAIAEEFQRILAGGSLDTVPVEGYVPPNTVKPNQIQVGTKSYIDLDNPDEFGI